jgi:hypothetical protein
VTPARERVRQRSFWQFTDETIEGEIHAWRSVVVIVFTADLVAHDDREPCGIVP